MKASIRLRPTHAAGLALAAVLALAPGTARADLIFTGSGISTDTGNLVSAQATFSLLPGGVLQIVLCNTSPNPEAIRRGDTLTGVIWDIDGANPTLSGFTVSRGTSDIYVNKNTINNATSLVGRWIFKGAPGGPYTYSKNAATFEYGVSAIGGGVFGGAQGDDYGLIADVASLDNPSFSASAFPLIVRSATFTFSGFKGSLDDIVNVRFTFGSGPNYIVSGRTPQGVAVPEPGSAVLVGAGLATAGLIGVWRRRRRAAG